MEDVIFGLPLSEYKNKFVIANWLNKKYPHFCEKICEGNW